MCPSLSGRAPRLGSLAERKRSETYRFNRKIASWRVFPVLRLLAASPPISLGRHYESTVAPLLMTSLAAGKRRLCERTFAILVSFLGEAKEAVPQVPNKRLFSVECEPVQPGHCAAREPGWPPKTHLRCSLTASRSGFGYYQPLQRSVNVSGSSCNVTLERESLCCGTNISAVSGSDARFTSLQAARMTRVPLLAVS